jgi:hypothetical protein
MVTKKELNPNVHEKKKKRGKNKRHLLTSMTYHIKEKQVEDGEPEELPEDGIGENLSDNLGEIKETITEDKVERSDSEEYKKDTCEAEFLHHMSGGGGEENCNDIKHVLYNEDGDSNKMIKTDSKTHIGLTNFELGKHSNQTIKL